MILDINIILSVETLVSCSANAVLSAVFQKVFEHFNHFSDFVCWA